MLAILFTLLGLIFLIWRLKPWLQVQSAQSSQQNLVSIILPCRNEEAHIEGILESLLRLDYPNKEIIVVDDSSTDQTAKLAQDFKVRLISAGPKPEQWCGKNWACWRGAQEAKGDLLLFTDADTRHAPDSLARVLSFMAQNRARVVSCPPRYALKIWGEEFLGFFYHLPLLITAYRQPAKAGRVYAIGQYLLFDRAAYFQIGGHEAISKSLVDDIDLAERSLAEGLRYEVYPKAELFDVQMYPDYRSFFNGWRRLLRLGMKRSSGLAFFEVFCLFHLLLIAPFSGNLFQMILAFIAYVFFAGVQGQQGPFSVLGALLIPLNIILFVGLTLLALKDKLLKKAVLWHDRAYAER